MPRPIAGVVLLLWCAAAPAAAQRTTWVSRLGTDTAMVEAVERDGPVLRGTILYIAAGLLAHGYEARLDATGRVESLRAWPIAIPGGDSVRCFVPAVTVTVGADSVRAHRRDRMTDRRWAVAAVPGVVPLLDPYFFAPLALLDLAARHAARSDTAVVYYVGAAPARRDPIARHADGWLSYAYPMAEQYPMMAGARVRVQVRDGELAAFDAGETTFKYASERGSWTDVLALAASYRARGIGPACVGTMSPARSATGRVGATDARITWGQPSVRGRAIFGGVVPLDRVWRAGANTGTAVRFSAPVHVEGRPLAAGEYSLWVVPGAATDTLIINAVGQTWGVMHDPARDLFRVPMRREVPLRPVEALAWSITPDGPDAARLTLEWADRRLSVRLTPGGP